MLAYIAWLFVSRVMNSVSAGGEHGMVSDVLHGLEPTLLLDISACFMVFSAALQLDKEQRGKMIKNIALFCTVFYFAISITAIIVKLTNLMIIIPPEFSYFAVKGKGGYVTILSNSGNLNAGWLYIGMCLSTYLMYISFNKGMKCFSGAAVAVEFIAIFSGGCKTVKIVVCISAAMYVMLFMLRLIGNRKKNAAILVAVTAIAGLAVCFVTGTLVSKIIFKASDITASAFEAAYSERLKDGNVRISTIQQEQEENPTSAGEKEPVVYESPLKTFLGGKLYGVLTFSERTFVWQAGFKAAEERPAILLMGSPRDSMMELPNKYARGLYGIGRDHEHMHNFLMQTIMLTGIPGLMLAAAFCLLITVKLVKLFFDRKVNVEAKMLLIPAAGLMVQGLFEAGLFTAIDMRAVYFFLFAGIVVKEYSENRITE